MNIFITGASGFIGKNLVVKLVNKGHNVIALTRRYKKNDFVNADNLKLLIGDLTNDFSNELNKCDTFIHLASHGVVDNNNDWETCFKVNVIDSLNLLLNAVNQNVKRFIIIGSCFEYGKSSLRYESIPTNASLEPVNAYSASKAAFTSAAYGIGVDKMVELAILRPFQVYGLGECDQRFWPQLIETGLSGKDFKMTKGDQIRDFQNVDETCNDIISWCENISLKKGFPRIINLGSGKPKSLLEFALSEWERINATGRILPGVIPYRKNEIMKYIPDLSKQKER